MKAFWAPLLGLHMLLAAAPLQAQPCGWDNRDLKDGWPASLAALLAREGTDGRHQSDAREFLDLWIQQCDATAGRRATRALRNAVDRSRGSDVANALYAISLARGPEVQVAGTSGYLFRAVVPNSNAEKEAARRLTAVVQRTGWPEVVEELTALVLATRNSVAMREAARVITEHARANGIYWIEVAEIELARGDVDAARAAAAHALAAGARGGTRVRAIVNLMTADSIVAGAGQYVAGLNDVDALTLQKYYDDLVPLLTPAEMEAWKKLPDPERPRWIRRAWEWRASIASLHLPIRLSTHFTRLDYAFQAYRRQSFRPVAVAAVWIGDRLPPLPLDDRGIIFVRHGEPDEFARAMTPASDMAGGASNRMAWFYRRLAGGRAVLEFDKSRSSPDYFLADPSRDCDSSAPVGSHYRQLLLEWTQVYGTPANTRSGSPQCYATIAGDTGSRFWSAPRIAALTANAVLETESAEPRFKKPIEVLVNAYSMRAGFGTDVAVFLWARAAGLTPIQSGQSFTYQLPLFVALEDPSSHTVIRTDTSFMIRRSSPFDPDDQVAITRTLHTQSSGQMSVRVSLRNEADAAQGQISVSRRDVPDYRRGFALSDIVVAEARDGTWSRGDVRLAPLPGHGTRSGLPFRLYYEVYGTEANEEVDVEILLVPSGSSGVLGALRDLVSRRQAMTVSFRDIPATRALEPGRLVHEITADLESGTYNVIVRVTRGTRETAERSTHLHVF